MGHKATRMEIEESIKPLAAEMQDLFKGYGIPIAQEALINDLAYGAEEARRILNVFGNANYSISEPYKIVETEADMYLDKIDRLDIVYGQKVELQDFVRETRIISQEDLKEIQKYDNVNLQNCSLKGLEFTGDYKGADFSYSEFYDCRFINADFSDAIFKQATLTKTDIQDTQFKHVNFNNTNIFTCNVENTQYEKCDFTSAKIIDFKTGQGVVFDSNSFWGCTMEDCYLNDIKAKGNQQGLETIKINITDRTEAEIQQHKEMLLHKLQETTGKDRLFVDMDGTLTVFKPVDTLETLYEKNYFRDLEPHENVVEAIRSFIKNNPETNVYIMSSVLPDSPYALQEKNAWLDKYLPEIDYKNRIFPPCGEDKKNYVPGEIKPTDYLLDDYTRNLNAWEPPAKSIKLRNGINHTRGTWEGSMVRYDRTPLEIAADIRLIMDGKRLMERTKGQVIQEANETYDSKGKPDYIDEMQCEKLETLSREQAQEAYRERMHVFYRNSFSEYHGSHKDEYRIIEIRSESQINELYDTHGNGIMHIAFISPYYENPKELKKLLAHSESDIQKGIRKSGYKPTDRMVANIKKLNEATGKNNGLKDIENMYREKNFENDQVKEFVNDIADECRHQEIVKAEVHLQVEATP